MDTKNLKSKLKYVRAIVDGYLEEFHQASLDGCQFRGEICTCSHPNNEHWISVVGGPITCKPDVCPYLKEKENV